MPSAFGHALFASSLTPFRPYRGSLLTSILLSMICATIEDLDVIGFQFGIHYKDMLGHRGFTHSILFAMLLAIAISYYFFKDTWNNYKEFFLVCWFYFLCSVSHGLLDAMTNGGLGVGFFIPFSNERYFFSYRPIPVSPLNMQSFFTSYGWTILEQELIFIGTLSFFLLVAGYFWRKQFMK